MQESFKLERLEIIQQAIHAVLNVAPITSRAPLVRSKEVRALAARCVISEARAGELDPVALAQKSSLLFCATRVLLNQH
jgi:hypothetical protein